MSTFDLRYLRYFIAVAEELNFTRAAERLHTVQPSLSQQIRRLEEEIVGTPLFWRQGYHLQLSAAGKVFLVEARRILAQTDEAIEAARRAARAESGNLVLSFGPGAEGLFKDFLLQVHTAYPGIHLTIRSLQSPDQLRGLDDRSIDVGFIAGPVDDPALVTEIVDHQRIMVIFPASHRMARRKSIPVEELADMPLVRPGRHVPSFNRIVEEIARQNHVRFTTAVEVDNVLAAVNEVANGAGFGLVPEYVSYLLPRELVSRPLDMKTALTLDLFMAYRADNPSPALQMLVDAFHKFMRESAPGAHEPASPATSS